MSATDILGFGFILLVIAVGFFSLNYMSHTITDKVLTVKIFNETPNVSASLNGSVRVADRLDYVFFGCFIGLILGIIVTAWFIPGNPLFTFIYFLIILIASACSFVIANVFEIYINKPVFASTIINFPLTTFIIGKLPFFVIPVGLIGIIILFGKPQQNV
jgi:hypothetical protein